MANEIAKPNPNQLATVGQEFNDVGATGFEKVTASDLLIPRLTILQGLSPQVTKGKPEYDDEARVGDIYDVGLQQSFPEGVQIVAAHYNKAWLEWAPRASGKGLQTIHEDDGILAKTTRDARNQPILASGNLIAETAQFYVLNLSTHERRKSFIPMVSTQIKKARRLLTFAQSERAMINGVEKIPPLFWRTYMLTTVPESNSQGAWVGWKIERGPLVQERDDWREILLDVKALRDAVIEGRAVGDLGAGEDHSKDGAM